MMERNDATRLEEEVIPPVQDPTESLTTLFKQFLISTEKDKARQEALRLADREELDDLRNMISNNNNDQTPFAVKSTRGRRNTIFFNDDASDQHSDTQQNKFLLSKEIDYSDHQLTSNSLAGLQYFSNQKLFLQSKHDGAKLKYTHMVGPRLRTLLVNAWNNYQYDIHITTGQELEEISVENWFDLTNDEVTAILLVGARPITLQEYQKELIQFLSHGIHQSPLVNPENFSTKFYTPLIKSLTAMHQLYNLLSEETKYSSNKKKMSVQGFGTRESPGHIQCWLIALGSQKDPILQFLDKSELMKFKDLNSAVKYIRLRLMEVKAHSESRRNFDSRFTPVHYEDYVTQGESYKRLPTQPVNRPPTSQSTPRPQLSNNPTREYSSDTFRNTASRSTLHALEYEDPAPTQLIFDDSDEVIDTPMPSDHNDEDEDFDHDSTISESHEPYQKGPLIRDQDPSSLAALDPSTSPFKFTIGTIFRGYCSEKFVFNKCSKGPQCKFKHGAPELELCIKSFDLLAKRQLGQHADLPPYYVNDPASSHYRHNNDTPKILSKSAYGSQQSYSKPAWSSSRPSAPTGQSYPSR
jgi:hypothetical protein